MQSVSPESERLLSELRASILFAPDFPKRAALTYAERASLGPDRTAEVQRPGLQAIERARPVVKQLEAMVRGLGQSRYEPAVPLLAELWRTCALEPVRIAAGHALYALQSDAARQALESTIEDSDLLSTFLAIRAAFDCDPGSAYDRLHHWFDRPDANASAVAEHILYFLAPGLFSSEGGKPVPVWIEPRVPDWLKQDPRWLELCARLRRGETLGAGAREVLRHADPALRQAALEKTRRSEAPRRIARYTAGAGNLLARYKAGEFAAVWREIGSHESIGGNYLAEAAEVADETMRRVARNADLLSERLAAAGWQPLFGELRTKPDSADVAVMEKIEAFTGAPLPLSLGAFWSVVGGIDWVWNYECGIPTPDLGVDLTMDRMDPLCIDAARLVDYLLEGWEDQKQQPDPDLVGPFVLDIAPDHLHKANISGGAPYGVELPCLRADPLFANERHNLSFTNYLRLCFLWAGFPGLEDHADRRDVQRFVATFGAGLEPF